MVDIKRPPPAWPPSPLYHDLPVGTQLVRIFDPTSYGATAVGFRTNGPRARFDHQRPGIGGVPADDPTRAIIYAGFSLSCCLVEYFGDTKLITFGDCHMAGPRLTRTVHLLDLRDGGAMLAGTVAAVSSTPDRAMSQSWSRYFYDLFSDIDGIIFCNAHNYEHAVALYERCAGALVCDPNDDLRLDDPRLRAFIQKAALENNLLIL